MCSSSDPTLHHQQKPQFNAKSKVMPEPTDLRTICSALDHFFLPAALGNIEDDAFVVWSQLFKKELKYPKRCWLRRN
jgi:hypothetical protein